MAGRPRGATGVRLTEAHRDKIQKSNILNALIEHAEGRREMSSTQVTAGLGLLKKALPDLSSVEQTTTHEAGDSIKALMDAINGRTRSVPKSD